MMMMVVRPGNRNNAPSPGNGTTHMLKLDRSVVDMIPIAQHMVQRMQNAVALRWRHVIDQNMATERA